VILDARGLEAKGGAASGIAVEILYLGQKYTLNITEEITFFDINK
jgi:hypothetical protein